MVSSEIWAQSSTIDSFESHWTLCTWHHLSKVPFGAILEVKRRLPIAYIDVRFPMFRHHFTSKMAEWWGHCIRSINLVFNFTVCMFYYLKLTSVICRFNAHIYCQGVISHILLLNACECSVAGNSGIFHFMRRTYSIWSLVIKWNRPHLTTTMRSHAVSIRFI